MSREEPRLQDRRNDTGLVLLRIGAGLSLLLIFGLQKLHAGWAFLHTHQWEFVDFNQKVGLPFPVLMAYLQTLNESVGALLVACGLFSRIASGALAVGFAVATACSFKMQEPAWLMAGYFCLMFATLLLTGPGRFSIDFLLESRRQTPKVRGLRGPARRLASAWNFRSW